MNDDHAAAARAESCDAITRSGRRRFTEEELLIAARLTTPTHPSRKRVFEQKFVSTAFDGEGLPSLKEEREWRENVLFQKEISKDANLDKRPDEARFEFLRASDGVTWKPSGLKGAKIPAPPPISLPVSHKKVASPSPRLLSTPKRPTPKPLPKSPRINVNPLIERLTKDVELRRKKHEDAIEEALSKGKPQTPVKLKEDELQSHALRLSTQAVQQKEKRLEALRTKVDKMEMENCCGSSRKLSKKELAEFNTRMYYQQVEACIKASEKADQKYMKSKDPVFAKLTEDQRDATSARLFSSERRK